MTLEQEIKTNAQRQAYMLSIAREMLKNKKALQKEIKEDMKNPEIRAAIDELKKRNESRYQQL